MAAVAARGRQRPDGGGADGGRGLDSQPLPQGYSRQAGVRRSERLGSFAWVGADEEVLAYRRDHGDDRRVVAVNFSGEAASIAPVPGPWAVEVSSANVAPERPVWGRGSPSDGLVLLPDEAVILRPAAPP